jgi:hypothetical protein
VWVWIGPGVGGGAVGLVVSGVPGGWVGGCVPAQHRLRTLLARYCKACVILGLESFGLDPLLLGLPCAALQRAPPWERTAARRCSCWRGSRRSCGRSSSATCSWTTTMCNCGRGCQVRIPAAAAAWAVFAPGVRAHSQGAAAGGCHLLQ